MRIFLERYFTINANDWTTTVRYCLKIGFYLGVLVGAVILLELLS